MTRGPGSPPPVPSSLGGCAPSGLASPPSAPLSRCRRRRPCPPAAAAAARARHSRGPARIERGPELPFARPGPLFSAPPPPPPCWVWSRSGAAAAAAADEAERGARPAPGPRERGPSESRRSPSARPPCERAAGPPAAPSAAGRASRGAPREAAPWRSRPIRGECGLGGAGPQVLAGSECGRRASSGPGGGAGIRAARRNRLARVLAGRRDWRGWAEAGPGKDVPHSGENRWEEAQLASGGRGSGRLRGGQRPCAERALHRGGESVRMTTFWKGSRW